MTADVRDRLRQLTEAREKATPGPWFAWDRGVGWHLCTEDPAMVGRGSVPVTLPEGLRTDLARGEDAAVIVAEHNAVPWLVVALTAVLDLADDYAFLGATLHNVPKAETFAEVADELRAVVAAAGDQP